MRKSWGTVLVFSALVLSASAGAIAGQGKGRPPAVEEKAAPAAPPGFEASPEWSKIDPGLQASWRDAMSAGDGERRFDVFVRCREGIDEGDKSFLLDRGFVTRAASGPIASGHLKAEDLQDVAGLPFVVSIKSSQ